MLIAVSVISVQYINYKCMFDSAFLLACDDLADILPALYSEYNIIFVIESFSHFRGIDIFVVNCQLFLILKDIYSSHTISFHVVITIHAILAQSFSG